MKAFSIYRDIRMKALIFGLPVGSFAILMTSVIASLLVMIFSFGIVSMSILAMWNLGLYVLLLKSLSYGSFSKKKGWITSFSNKQTSNYGYYH